MGPQPWTAQMAFEGTWLVFSSVEHLRREALSPSSALAIERCPARWAAELTVPRPEDPYGAAELGTAAHAALEALLRLPPAQRRPEAAWEAVVAQAPQVPVADLGMWHKEVWGRIAGLWQIAEPANLNVLATEAHIQANVEGIPLHGYVDLAVGTPGGVVVVDHKTGRPKGEGRWPGYADQIRVYALLWEQAHGEAPAGGELWFTRWGVGVAVDLSAQAKQRTVALARRSWGTLAASLREGRFATQPSGLCCWCPLVGSCPAAKRAGYQAAPPTIAATGNDRKGGEPVPAMVNEAMVNEAKPWEPFCYDGTPNWASYQAINARRLVDLAKDCLTSTGQALTPKALRGYAALFAEMVYATQRALGRKPTLQSALANHIVAFLVSSTRDVMPPTLGDPAEAMSGWSALMTRRLVKLCQLTYDLMMAGTETSVLTAEAAEPTGA